MTDPYKQADRARWLRDLLCGALIGAGAILPGVSGGVLELRHGKVERYTVKPEDFGLTRCTKADLAGGTALENAEITKNILLGKSTPEQRTAAVLNAGAAIYVAIDGLSLKDAMQKAQDVIDDGSAYKKLQAFIRITNEEDDQ